jgi:tryptophanyl-tRNA synthetase
MKAVTDSLGDIRFSEETERAGVNNLLTIYQALTDKTKAEVEADFADARGYGDLKKAVVEVVNDALSVIQGKYRELMDDLTYLDRVLGDGANKARAVADVTLAQVYDRMGFLPPRG